VIVRIVKNEDKDEELKNEEEEGSAYEEDCMII